MDQFVRSQNVARYRRLLERVTDESDRQQIIDLAKIFRFSHMLLSAAAGPTNPHTRFVTGGSVFRASCQQ